MWRAGPAIGTLVRSGIYTHADGTATDTHADNAKTN